MKIGDKAPDFSLPNQDNKLVSLGDFKGKWVVLYFYPKDNTPGCTLEAIDFTNKSKDFESLKAVVLGISADSVKSHCNFIEKQNLKITLLSDQDHKIIEKYGAWGAKSMYGKEYMGIIRSTFLIGGDGQIAFIWTKVDVKGHAEEVKSKIKALKG